MMSKLREVRVCFLAIFFLNFSPLLVADETLPPLKDDKSPQTFEAMLVQDLDGLVRYFDILTMPNTGVGPLEFLDTGAYELNCSDIPGDNNCDGVVDFVDVAILAANWLTGK